MLKESCSYDINMLLNSLFSFIFNNLIILIIKLFNIGEGTKIGWQLRQREDRKWSYYHAASNFMILLPKSVMLMLIAK